MNRNIKPNDVIPSWIAEVMRDACPVAGRDWMKYMEVTLKPGENIKAHAHRYHAVLYYPRPADPVIIHPMPGTMIYMPPLTTHEVPPVKSERISIAMIIEEPK